MVNEIKFSSFAATREFIEDVDVEGLVRLFLNHRSALPGLTLQELMSHMTYTRPAFGLAPSDLEVGFASLLKDSTSLGVSDLVDLLREEGEKMSEDEITRVFSDLLGDGALSHLLPERINHEVFAKDIVGFE
jgi:hypothetical protein